MDGQAGGERRIDLEGPKPAEIRRGQVAQGLGIVADVAPVVGAQAKVGEPGVVDRDDRVLAVGEGLVMDPGEVGHVDETLDLAGGRAGDVEERRQNLLETRRVPQRKGRQASGLVAGIQAGPDEAVALDHREHGDLQLWRGLGVRVGGDLAALAVGAVAQAVIGADDLLALHPAQAQRKAAMGTQVTRHPDGLAGPVDHQLDVQQRDRQRLVGQVDEAGDRKPLARQDRPVLGVEGAVARQEAGRERGRDFRG